MIQLLLALATGGLTGYLFGKLKLPIPGPPTLEGLMGIVGIFIGYFLARNC